LTEVPALRAVDPAAIADYLAFSPVFEPLSVVTNPNGQRVVVSGGWLPW